MSLEKMSPIERKAAGSLATLLALRMLGLFMILPVFSLYANQLTYSTPFLIGVAMGVYGLTQGLFQIPIGMLSDHIGRKKMIAAGLLIFIAGSLIAAFSHTIYGMIMGRTLQGVGAVGSAIIALLADLTRPNQRSKAMAISGMTIGSSFALAMILGPLLNNWVNLFVLAAIFGLIGLFVLIYFVPNPTDTHWHPETEPNLLDLPGLLKEIELIRLNTGIFLLHGILTATFIVLPLSLEQLAGIASHQQWLVYVPSLILAFAFSVLLLMHAEKNQQIKTFFLLGIILLGCAELLLWSFAKNRLLSACGLLLFFTAFSLLEAFLPSLVSRIAPVNRRGTALGIYSSSQFLGIFIGGIVGGWLYSSAGLTSVYLFCVLLTILWLSVAFRMKNPHHSIIH